MLVVVLLARSCGGATASPEEQLHQARAENPVHLTVSVSGDLLIHSPVWAEALALGGGSYDFAPMLAPLKPYVQGADIAFCHIETPMGPGEPSGYPLFKAPPELAGAVKATGWNACDTASNHSLDQHMAGIRSTGRALDEAGLPHTGSFASKAESEKPLIVEADGVKVALVAYTDYTNGIPLPTPWSLNFAQDESDVGQVLDDARRARRAGAEVVIVTFQWGVENSSTPDADQRAQARALTASPLVTAVVGSGPHVVQPIERINDKFVVFSEGNLLSNEDINCCPAASQDGLVALLDVVVDGDGEHVDGVRYVPVYVSRPDYSVLPVGLAVRDGELDAATARDSYERTVSVAGRGNGVEPIPAQPPG